MFQVNPLLGRQSSARRDKVGMSSPNKCYSYLTVDPIFEGLNHSEKQSMYLFDKMTENMEVFLLTLRPQRTVK